VRLRLRFSYHILTLIVSSGKTLYVPKIDLTKDGRMDFFQVYDEEDLESLPAGVWGIREPTKEYKGVERVNGVSALSIIL
jgi:5-formyltetrahydrofolate cyclo-ligase